MNYVLLLGRILFSSLFILKSFNHFSEKALTHATNMDVPVASIFVPITGLILLLGGFSILLGYKARAGGWLLAFFLAPTAFLMHPFWNVQDSYASMMEQFCFMKNLSLLGAALMIAYFGSGPLSLDKRR